MAARPAFPVLRWFALAWLAVYLPSYAEAYGFANFLFLCNLGVLLVVAGLWRGSALLLSSQAVGILIVSLVWTLDVSSRLLTGAHWIGGTEYMWDPTWPLFTRLLSLYHAAIPFVLLHGLRRLGYDRRAYALQSAIAIAGVLVGRLFGAAANINGAFLDPLFKRAWGPPPVHMAVVAATLVCGIYPLAHFLLRRAFRPASVSA
jgi:hypothetical protein